MLCERKEEDPENGVYTVLILVLMEDALRERNSDPKKVKFDAVLILVLMEDALREISSLSTNPLCSSLNPCSNGRCSASSQ